MRSYEVLLGRNMLCQIWILKARSIFKDNKVLYV